MSELIRVLYIDDCPADRELVREAESPVIAKEGSSFGHSDDWKEFNK